MPSIMEAERMPGNKDYERYIEARFDAVEKRTKAIKEETDRRMSAMNEVREQLNRQATEFLTIKEYNPSHESLKSAITDIRERLIAMETRDKSGKADWAGVLKIALLCLTALAAVGTVVVAFKK